jgi:2-polyprenyl-6-hydroxyphenyl methylase/3-demethylubiquinone-9 3-methyltransferase
MKEGMKWMWSLGDYPELAARLLPCAEALAVACDLRSPVRVLDVAAGTGNFAIARRGATVNASDLTPRMVELGRAASDAEGLDIEWVEADAEELPFHADRFDVVASVFGAMFAPRPERVAAGMFRVARPGGIVAMANYAPQGFLARLADLMSDYASAPAAPLPSPFLWGDPGEIHRRFQDLASSVDLRRETLTFEFASPDDGMEFWERTNPPLLALRAMLPANSYNQLRERTAGLMAELNQARDSRLVLHFDYLTVLARKPER